MLFYFAKFLSKKVLFGILVLLPILCVASGIDYKYGFDARSINLSHGIDSKPVFDIENISYIPRVYLSGYTGIGLLGQGDILAPVYLTADRVFAIYGQGRYTPVAKELREYKTWTGSAGLLYRQIIPHIESVVGGYVLGDHSQARDGHKYWVVSPGIEILGLTWDFRLNGYIPVGKKSWSNEDWTQNFGNYSYMQFAGNNVYDHKFAYYDEIGVGSDVEIGRKLFKFDNVLIKGYAQGYYHRANYNADVIGGGVKITLQPNNYITFSANYTYDNYQNNVFMLGAQIKLNDLFANSNKPSMSIEAKNLSNRLFDLVDRSYANIGSGMTAPMTGGRLHDLGLKLYNSETVFVGSIIELGDTGNNGGTGNDKNKRKDLLINKKGTYENPYTQEDVADRGMQKILDEIHDNFPNKVDIYFAPGIYINHGSPINLYQGISAIGKDFSYTRSAKRSEEKPIIIGSMQLSGDNIIDSMILKNQNGLFSSGIVARNASNIVLKNVEVGTLTEEGNYATGITMDGSHMAINDSKIYAYQKGNPAYFANNELHAIGIKITAGGSLIVSGSEVKGMGIAEEDNEYRSKENMGNGYGIHADGIQEQITIEKNSNVTGYGKGSDSFSGNGYGIFVGKNCYGPDYHSDKNYDGAVYGNKIKILDSSIKGEGNVTNNKHNKYYWNSRFVGNGYGLLVGHGYQNFDERNKNGIFSSIHNNMVIVENSHLSGIGVYNNFFEKKTDIADYSGNGYGMLIGSGTINIFYGYRGSFDIESKIFENSITITNSNLIGISINNYSDAQSSAHSYGLLIGNGFFEYKYYESFKFKTDLSIHDNILTITRSNITSNTSRAPIHRDQDISIDMWSKMNAAKSLGILIGYGQWRYANERNDEAERKLEIISDIAKNNLAIHDSTININYDALGSSDLINRRDNYLSGILIGSIYNNIAPKNDNILTINNSAVNFNLTKTDRGNAYGIIMSGKLTIDDYTKEHIGRNDGLTGGEKIDTNDINLKWTSGQ